MYTPPPLSDQQNMALWVIGTFAATAVVLLLTVGLLGILHRRSGPSDTDLH